MKEVSIADINRGVIEISLNTKVLLTGASGGIGNAIARELGRRGARLTLSARKREALAELAEELDAAVVPADLCRPVDVERLIEESGEVDVLVANAALPASGTLDDFTAVEIDRALDVNLRAPIMLAKALAPAMRERGGGHLVFIASMSGKVATPGSAIYSATKFGLRGFASGLRQDLHGSGVGVSTVCPGPIRDAGMFADSGVKAPWIVGSRTPEEVATAVVRAIERKQPEIDVASLPTRVSSKVAQLAPAVNEAILRRIGVREIAAEVAAGQRDKR